MSRFLVTAAAGKTGGATVDHCSPAATASGPWSAATTTARARSPRPAPKSCAATSSTSTASPRRCDGVSGAYFCYPIRAGLLDATVTFAQAATENGVRSVVDMSQISARREARSNAARQHWLAERVLERTGLLTTHLRPTFFAEWLTSWWELRDGEGSCASRSATAGTRRSPRPTRRA